MPDPIEKWAVWAASPSRISRSWCQRLADYAAELEPHSRAGQVGRIAEQWLPLEVFGKDALAQSDRFGLVQPVEAEPLPGAFRAFDDEGRAVVGKAIGMGPDPARLGLLEREGESVERLGRAEPYETVGSFLDVDPEMVSIGFPKPAVDPVRGDDEIPAAPGFEPRVALRFIMDVDPELAGALGQYLQQALAADPDKTMSGRPYARSMDMNVDIVPMGEFVGDDLP